MNEQQAWLSFVQSGRVEDYIRYAQLKPLPASQDNAPGGRPGKGGSAGERENPGTDYPGTAGWGK